MDSQKFIRKPQLIFKKKLVDNRFLKKAPVNHPAIPDLIASPKTITVKVETERDFFDTLSLKQKKVIMKI